MMQFKKSPVIFDEDSHSYQLGDKKLLGITGLIHSILGLGVYPDASEHVKDFIIPRAGSRGTAVHHAIQTYDQIGIKQTTQIVHTRYGCRERDNIYCIDESWDVSAELESYIRHMQENGFRPLANELTVSDNKRYASQIDNVWQKDTTGGIWLVDTKTNNLKLYPLCGYFIADYFNNGEDALKEYLSWQLSIYAELFEAENSGLKVEGLACNWLKADAAAFWIIERKPSYLVNELLNTVYFFGDKGPVYFHHDVSLFGIDVNRPVKAKESTPILAPDVIDYFTSLLKTYKETEAKLEEAKKALRAAMTTHNVKSFDFGTFSATVASDSTTSSFDSKRFKQEHADLYAQYTSQKTKKGGLTIKLKDND